MNRSILAGIILLMMVIPILAQNDDLNAPITAENSAELTLKETLTGHTMGISALAFHPQNADVIVSTSRDLSLRITDISTEEVYFESYPHNAVAYGLAFSPNGEMLFTGSWDRTVKRYRLLEGYQLDELPAFVGFSHIVDHVQFSTDGEWVGFGVGDGSVHILSVNDYDVRNIFMLDGLAVNDFTFLPTTTPDLVLFAVAVGFPQDKVLLGNFADETLQPLEHGHANGVTAIAIYPQDAGWAFVTAGDDGLLEIRQLAFEDGWQISPNVAQINPEGDLWFTSLTFNPSGDLLVAGTQEGIVYVYDVREIDSPKLLTILEDSKNHPIQTLTFSADGSRLAGGGENGQIFIWQP
jgi:WD40 repeat protein